MESAADSQYSDAVLHVTYRGNDEYYNRRRFLKLTIPMQQISGRTFCLRGRDTTSPHNWTRKLREFRSLYCQQWFIWRRIGNVFNFQKMGRKGHRTENQMLLKFDQYCQPRKNEPFERYKLNHRDQEPAETYDKYRTVLWKITDCSDFNTITTRPLAVRDSRL